MAEEMDQCLPATFQGLQFSSSTAPASVVQLPTPQSAPGTVILRPLYSNLVSYAKEVFCNGNPRKYNYPLPIVPGTNAIARVAAVASDTPHLKPGMLVYTSGIIRPRDSIRATPNLQGIQMGFTPEHEALMRGEWRNGCWAELVKVPAENVHILDEKRLTEKLGYDLVDLGYLSTLAVAYGGLDDVNLCPGETAIIAPATGNFGSAAVQVALSMGAGKVIAMGRNLDKLKQLQEFDDRVTTVAISGDFNQEMKDLQAEGPVDVYFDISSNLQQDKATYVQAAIMSLRPGGRMSIMGGFAGPIELPYIMIMYKGITIKGTFMYTREQAEKLIKIVESGLLPIGKRGNIQVTGVFHLEQWQEAFDHAFNNIGPKRTAYFKPNKI
ncbi:hypothetical protein NLG97_g4017 [Lecanicillium saksenae]|uniref:Uncharacterized protein n=1 Tax=Lecanicillium saksenae TaxID=468837 RepID=A0ACC1QWG9_9HYPO|nr:hypothetical protein NLG97_g4017 [Lecanicillium saksenae]